MRRGWLVLLFALALLAGPAPTRAWAVAAPAGEAHPADHAEGARGHGNAGHEESGLFGPWALDLAIWTIVVFLVVLFILGRFAWEPMLRGLEKREQAIRAAVEEADIARKEAHQLREQLQREMDTAHDRVRQLLDDARRDAEHATQQIMSKARAEMETERKRLHQDVEMARDQALQQIWNQAAQLATLVSAKAIRRQLTPDDHRRLVDEALAELREAGTERRQAV